MAVRVRLAVFLNAFAFGGARAGGGQVTENRAYTVGERGRETFVPSTAGRIVPNSGQSGGVQIVQHFDFSNADQAVTSQLARTAQSIKDETFNSVFSAINAGRAVCKGIWEKGMSVLTFPSVKTSNNGIWIA